MRDTLRWIKFTRDNIHQFNPVVKDGQYYINNKLVVFEDEINDILLNLYGNPLTGLVGRDKFYDTVKDKYYGISKARVNEFLKANQNHQLHTIPKKVKASQPIVANGPRKLFMMDLIILRENSPQVLRNDEDVDNSKITDVILTCIDVFSKFAYAVKLPNKTAGQIVKHARKILTADKPRMIQTDNGPEFVNNMFTDMLNELNIRHKRGKAYLPKQQSQIERFNGTLKKLISRFKTQYNVNTIRPQYLKMLVQNYNNNIHSSTRARPVELHNNKELIKEAFTNLSDRASDIIHDVKDLRPGDKVRVNLSLIKDVRKFRQLKRYAYLRHWTQEVYVIERVIRGNYRRASRYIVEGFDEPINRVDLLKVGDEIINENLEEGEYVVHYIVDDRGRGNNKMYKVRWYGYGPEDDSWIYARDLKTTRFENAIEEYRRKS